MPHNQIQLVLGSSSIFRAAILNQMGFQYQVVVPDIDETPNDNEPVISYVIRLAEEKAQAVLKKLPVDNDFLIIASDQSAADEDGVIYGKPETIENAVSMLKKLSGKHIYYYCAVSLYSTLTKEIYTDISTTVVKFKNLSDRLIYRYLQCEPQAIACSSGLRIESCGAMLVEEFSSPDPASCQGLPCLVIDKLLAKHGYEIADFIPIKEALY